MYNSLGKLKKPKLTFSRAPWLPHLVSVGTGVSVEEVFALQHSQ